MKELNFSFKRLESTKVFIFFALVNWIAHFLHSNQFGLYGDDYTLIFPPIGMSWSDFWGYLSDNFEHFGYEGRPLQQAFLCGFSFLGGKLGGLAGVYWIEFLLTAINSFLFYTLLKRLFNQPSFFMTGALAFCLFPAQTTRQWLTFSLGFEPALMFFLLATHCYLSKNLKSFYFLTFCSLFCYETIFPIFLVIPLLNREWDSKLMPHLSRHALLLGSMLVSDVLIRKFSGENRVASLNLSEAIITSISHMVTGPVRSIQLLFLSSPFTTIQALVGSNIIEELWIFLTLCFAGLAYLFSKLNSNVSVIEMSEHLKRLTKLALIGIIMLVLAYPLTLIGYPSEVGMGSHVNAAAVLGASILCGCICSTVIFIAGTYRKKYIANFGLATFFSLLVGFGLIVQQDYQLAWKYQRAYWSDVITLIPDLDDESVIFFDTTGLKKTKYMNALNWLHQTAVMSNLYEFPDEWKELPEQNFVNWRRTWINGFMLNRPNWQEMLKKAGDHLIRLEPWFADGPINKLEIQSSKIIVLEAKNKQLIRRTEPLMVHGQEFSLKEQTASGLLPFKKGSLYNYLIKSPEEERVDYFR